MMIAKDAMQYEIMQIITRILKQARQGLPAHMRYYSGHRAGKKLHILANIYIILTFFILSAIIISEIFKTRLQVLIRDPGLQSRH